MRGRCEKAVDMDGLSGQQGRGCQWGWGTGQPRLLVEASNAETGAEDLGPLKSWTPRSEPVIKHVLYTWFRALACVSSLHPQAQVGATRTFHPQIRCRVGQEWPGGHRSVSLGPKGMVCVHNLRTWPPLPLTLAGSQSDFSRLVPPGAAVSSWAFRHSAD